MPTIRAAEQAGVCHESHTRLQLLELGDSVVEKLCDSFPRLELPEVGVRARSSKRLEGATPFRPRVASTTPHGVRGASFSRRTPISHSVSTKLLTPVVSVLM